MEVERTITPVELRRTVRIPRIRRRMVTAIIANQIRLQSNMRVSSARAESLAEQAVAAREAGGDWYSIINDLFSNLPAIIAMILQLLALFG